jgi:hypothetical protein
MVHAQPKTRGSRNTTPPNTAGRGIMHRR